MSNNNPSDKDSRYTRYPPEKSNNREKRGDTQGHYRDEICAY